MSRYKYKARDNSGTLLEDEEEGGSPSEVSQKLLAKNLIPVHIELKEAGLDMPSFFKGFRKANLRDLSVFFRQISVVVSAGVPLFEGLLSVETESSNPVLKNIAKSIRKDISAGGSFSSALAKDPSIFSPSLVAMVEAAERGGVLGEVLTRISASLEKENQFRAKIKSALRYPAIVLTTLLFAFIVSILYIIPRFTAMFQRFGEALPLPTRILIGLNSVLTHYWWLVLLVIAVLYFVWARFKASDFGGLMIDEIKLKVPVFGSLYAKISLSRFFMMFADMLDSGVPLATALELTAKTADNKSIAKKIMVLRQRVVEGGLLSTAMKSSSVFPSVALHLTALGESTGRLSEMFMKISSYFDEDADYMVSNMMSLLEPFFVLVLGAFVLMLGLGIFLPMWDITNLYFK